MSGTNNISKLKKDLHSEKSILQKVKSAIKIIDLLKTKSKKRLTKPKA